MNVADYLDYGVAAVAIICLYLVVRMFVQAFGNHMSYIANTLQNLVEITSHIKDGVDDLRRR